MAYGVSHHLLPPYAIRHTPYAALAVLVLLSACSLLQPHEPLDEPVNLIAVFPIQRSEPTGAAAPDEPPQLAPGAERTITADIYGVLASSPEWRFVPDLTVTQTLAKLPHTGSLESQARDLGKAVGADAVLYGTVFRFAERVGSQYGAQRPARVGFRLRLASVATGKILWEDSFDQTQEPLSSNLFNWWMFWQAGPKWFTAQEFSRIAVQRVLDNLKDRL
jgi:hypothetical protein